MPIRTIGGDRAVLKSEGFDQRPCDTYATFRCSDANRDGEAE